VGNRNHWIGLRLTGGTRAGDIVGARVSVTLADGRTLSRRTRADGSYGSANDPRLVVGLGASAGRVDVRVQWPDSRVEQFEDLQVDRWTMLTRGSGR
jgi:enediyne biosynthesis protein E4